MTVRRFDPVDTEGTVEHQVKAEVAMHWYESTAIKLAGAGTVAAALLLGCAHHPPPRQFTADAPFSRNFAGAGDAVCWSVKRALLSQGYMLDRPNESGVMTGSRDQQPTPKVNITTRLQTTCADNRNGTSIVFVTATREQNQLQKMQQSTSMGVGPATLTLPSGSAKVLGTVRRETISDPDFYGQFFALVQNYVDQEKLSQAAVPAVVHAAPLQSESSSQPPAAN
jgi:hypothetical protein